MLPRISEALLLSSLPSLSIFFLIYISFFCLSICLLRTLYLLQFLSVFLYVHPSVCLILSLSLCVCLSLSLSADNPFVILSLEELFYLPLTKRVSFLQSVLRTLCARVCVYICVYVCVGEGYQMNVVLQKLLLL